jgi:hypothetical protein
LSSNQQQNPSANSSTSVLQNSEGQNLTLLNSKDIISLSEASRVTGYHQDYLAFLCRTGKLHSSKIGRNWVTTKAQLDDFIKNYKNGISEVADEAGNKIPVHVVSGELEDNIVVVDDASVNSAAVHNSTIFPLSQNQKEEVVTNNLSPSSASGIPLPFYNNPESQIQATSPAPSDGGGAGEPQKLELNNLRQSVFQDLEQRISKLGGSLGELEREVQVGTFNTKFLNERQQKVLEEDSVVTPLPIAVQPQQPLHEKFSSNFSFDSFNKPASQNPSLSLLGKEKIKQLYGSFIRPLPNNFPVVAAVTAIALVGFVGSVLLSNILTGKQLAENSNQTKIV